MVKQGHSNNEISNKYKYIKYPLHVKDILCAGAVHSSFLLLSRMLLGEGEQPNINPIKMVERLFIKLEQTFRGVFG